jgi:flagellar biosynthesis protein FlhA
MSIGVFQKDMQIGDAAKEYGILTVGDGLVSQIPALLFSTATGIIVSRAAADSDLGKDILGAFTRYPRPLYVASCLLFVLAIIPGLPTIPFVILGALLGILAYVVVREGQITEYTSPEKSYKAGTSKSINNSSASGATAASQIPIPAAPTSPEDVKVILPVDPMETEIGYAIIPLVDPSQGGDMLERIGTIRKQMAIDLGLVVPPIRIRDNIQIKPTEYIIRIKGAKVGSGELLPDHYLAMNTGAVEEEIVGIPTKEPAFGLPAVWISPDLRDKAETIGYTVVDAPSVMATHLSEIIKRNGADLITRQEIHKLTEMVKENSSAVVEDLLATLSLGEIQKVLQNLIREHVPIRDLVTIFETLSDFGKISRNADFLTERVRESLTRIITLKIQDDDDSVTVVTLSPTWEKKISESIEGDLARGWQLNLDPREMQKLIKSVSKACEDLAVKGIVPILLVHPNVRLIVRRLLEGTIPNIFVISYNEISSGAQIKTVGMVE